MPSRTAGKANNDSERKLEEYHGENLTSDEIAAITAHVADCETALGPGCYPLKIRHGADPRLPYRRQSAKGGRPQKSSA
jgi:hypothetical protein